LPVHEANNDLLDVNLASQYQSVYGDSSHGHYAGHGDSPVDQDVILAAPIWHDWAETIAFQWNAGGSEPRPARIQRWRLATNTRSSRVRAAQPLRCRLPVLDAGRRTVTALLARLAPEFGHDAADTTTFNTRPRNMGVI